MSLKLAIFPTDPLAVTFRKGEVKARYFNPGDLFDEVHVISAALDEVSPQSVSVMGGRAALSIHPVGPPRLASVGDNPLAGRYFQHVLEVVRSIKPHVIRAYNPLIGGYLAVRCGQLLRVPVVLSVHGNMAADGRLQSWREHDWKRVAYYGMVTPWMERFCLTRADWVICAYEFVARYVRLFRRDRHSVIYNRVYSQPFDSARPVLHLDRPIVLSVGRMIKAKNQQVLIHAMRGLNAYLVLVGQGDQLPHLRALVKQEGLEDQVRFIPAVSNADIAGYYLSASVYATGMHYGGVSIPILEAMAARLPLVVSRQHVVPEPELVHDFAVVVDNTPQGFHQGLHRVLSDPGLARTIGDSGRRRFESVSGELMEAKERQIYEGLLAGGLQ